MLVAFRAISAAGFAASSLTITTPAAAQSGDLLIALISESPAGGTQGTPAGWTRDPPNPTVGNGGRVAIFWAIVGQGGVTANQPTTFTGLGTASGVIVAYSGTDQTTPLDVTPHASTDPGTSEPAVGSLTTVSWADYIVLGVASFTNGSTFSKYTSTNPPAAAYTERLDTANGTSSSIAVADAQRNPFTAGATGAAAVTMTTLGASGIFFLALRPLATVASSTDGVTTGDVESAGKMAALSTTDQVTTGFVASATDIPGTGPPPTAGTITSGGLKFRSDGSLVVSTTKQAGAFRTTRGWTINPDGSVYTSSVVAASGAGRTADGFTFNPDGALVTVSSSTAIFKTSHGYSINRLTGATYISSTRNPGAYLDSLGVTLNLDGSVFAY